MAWASEVHEVSWIVWKTLFVKLSAVVTESKQANGTAECLRATRKTTRLASYAG